MKFPDGYVANISKNVNSEEGKIFGLKTHDCHILLQRLIPVGIRPYLKNDVVKIIVRLSNFFQQICARTLYVKDLDALQEEIVLILCKLENLSSGLFHSDDSSSSAFSI